MESSPPSQHFQAGPFAALGTAATTSLAGVYVLTMSISVTIIAAAVILGLNVAHLVGRR
jgi:hypothetical protein